MFQKTLLGKITIVMIDNTSVVSYLNKQGGTISCVLSLLAVRIHECSEPKGLILRVRYIPGKNKILADTLTRPDQVVGTEWSLGQAVANILFKLWEGPTLDLFVTLVNHRLSL